MRRECVGHRLQAPRHLLQDLNSPSEHTHAIESSSDTGSPPFSLEFGQSRYAGKVVRPPPLVRLLLVPRRRLLPPHTRWLVRASAGRRKRARPLAVACCFASRAMRHVLLRHHVGMSACHRGWPSCMAVRHALLSHCFWTRCPDTMILPGAPLLLSVSRWCQTKRDTFISSTQTSRKGRTGPIGIHGCVTEMPFSTSPFLVCPTPLACNPAAAAAPPPQQLLLPPQRRCTDIRTCLRLLCTLQWYALAADVACAVRLRVRTCTGARRARSGKNKPTCLGVWHVYHLNTRWTGRWPRLDD